MRVPHPVYHRNWIRSLFLILLGMILGAVLLMLYVSQELDSLYTKIIVLENDKANLEQKIELMEKELRSWNARNKINDVVIHLKESPNDIIEAELHKFILKDTRFLIGKDIRTIENAYESIFEIFSPKVYVIEEKEYRVQLMSMVIGTKIHLYLHVR